MMLTKKQRRVYDFIASRIHCTGRAPSYREMADFIGIGTTVGSAHQQVDRIIARGYLRRLSPHGQLVLTGGPPRAMYFRVAHQDPYERERDGWPKLERILR